MKKVALFTMLCAGAAFFAAGCTESTTGAGAEPVMPAKSMLAPGTTGAGTAPAAATANGDIAMPAGLTAEEQLIWNSLSDQAKRDAVAYMQAGGSFRDFVAV